MSKNIVTRKELYDLVWSTPVIHIAKEYGFSDNGLRKICKKYNIPLPNSGYWSKLKFNKKVVKTKLPKQNDDPQISLENKNAKLNTGNHPLSKLALIKTTIQESTDLNLTVPDNLSKPHKYTQATKEYHKQLKAVRRRGGWHNSVDKTNVLNIKVSENLYARALRFMDTLIKLVEKRGHQVTIDSVTRVVIKKQSYSIRVIEKHKRVKSKSNYSWDTFDLEPTGNMCLKIDNAYPQKEWSDGKSKSLEDRLIDILAWLEMKAEDDIQAAIEREIWSKKIQEERKIQEELQRQKDEEFAKIEELFQSATRLHKAQHLRNFIKEFEEYAIKLNTLDGSKKEWIKWAREKADWYDPFIEKEVPLLDDIDRDTLKPKKRRYW